MNAFSNKFVPFLFQGLREGSGEASDKGELSIQSVHALSILLYLIRYFLMNEKLKWFFSLFADAKALDLLSDAAENDARNSG